MGAVSVGDVAWARHKSGRFYKAKVEQVRQQLFVEVDFTDSSFSTDMYPQDIEVKVTPTWARSCWNSRI